MKLNPNRLSENVKMMSTREGFGLGILEAGKKNKNIVTLSADLSGSTNLGAFIKQFPKRFVQVGVAEQNLVTVASGLAHVGKIPFATSFAAFSPGRNWEQIRTTICYNNQPVKIIGSHTGLGVGEDGATHQMLEDIALMRVLPNMEVIVPCDGLQAKKATLALAKSNKPGYLRINRQKSPVITTEKTDFEIGKGQILREGKDVAIIVAGPLIYEALLAAEDLAIEGMSAMVVNMHTIKPIDKKLLVEVAKKTKHVMTLEDHQVHGGLGSAVCEVLAEHPPVQVFRMGVQDRYGESGPAKELFIKYGLSRASIFQNVKSMLGK